VGRLLVGPCGLDAAVDMPAVVARVVEIGAPSHCSLPSPWFGGSSAWCRSLFFVGAWEWADVPYLVGFGLWALVKCMVTARLVAIM
jgi:hypothetical protein